MLSRVALLVIEVGEVVGYLIGTRGPLRLRIDMDEVGRNGDTRSVVVRSVDSYCEDRKIVDPAELRIAMMLMFYGHWSEEQVVEEATRSS